MLWAIPEIHVTNTGTHFRSHRKLLPPNLRKNQEKRTKKERKTPPNPPKAGGREILSPLFGQFWDLYPRKVGKRTAEAAFNAAVNRGNKPEAIVAGLRGYTFHHDTQFQPHPTTWLRGDRWLDRGGQLRPVLRATGLRPEDFLDAPKGGLLQ